MKQQPPLLDGVFAALSDATRRSLVERLGHGPASVSALAEPFDMSLAAVLQHVQVLAECDLIRTEKVGRVRYCQLEPRALERARAWIVSQQEAFWKAGLGEDDRMLNEEDDTQGETK